MLPAATIQPPASQQAQPAGRTQPMPDNPRFNADLRELQTAFLRWCSQQPWAAEMTDKNNGQVV